MAIPLTGCPYIGYNAPVTVGDTQFELLVDTGSTDTVVALSSCTDCLCAPEYTPPAGSCGATTITYDYEGNDSLSGNVCSASLQTATDLPPVTVEFLGATAQTDNFAAYDCAGNKLAASPNEGVLALGPLNASLDNLGTSPNDAYFNALVQQGVPNIFAILLCSENGLMWFGGYDPSYANGPIQYTPLGQNGAGWTVQLTDISLGGTDLGGGNPNAYVDTGTFGFNIPVAAFSAFLTAISNNAAATQIFGEGVLDKAFFNQESCAAPLAGQTAAEIDAALPTMTLTFPALGSGEVTLNFSATESYLLPWTSPSGEVQYCGGVAGAGTDEGYTTLGDTITRANLTVFDVANQRLGFAAQSYCK